MAGPARPLGYEWRMRTIYSERHRLQDGKAELNDGKLVPCFEMPRRADLVLARVRDVGLGPVDDPNEHGLDPIVRVHTEAFVTFLREAWGEWTAEHGDYTGGPRIVTDETRKAMSAMLAEIQSGAYAKSWIEENRTGRKWFEAQRREGRSHQIEEVGTKLRGLMSFLDPVTVTPEGEVKRQEEPALAGVAAS